MNVELLGLCLLFALSNIPVVIGYKTVHHANNLIYPGFVLIVTGALMLVISWKQNIILSEYFIKNYIWILFPSIITILNCYATVSIINKYGASSFVMASLFNLLIPPTIVGYLIYKEKVNLFIIPTYFCCIFAVYLFHLSKR